MIFPILQGILSFKKAPVTWMIFVMNLLVMGYIGFQKFDSHGQLVSQLNEDIYLQVQGKFYSQFVLANSNLYEESTKDIATKALQGDIEKQEILGSLAVRDRSFLERYNHFSFYGDEVALEWWRKKLDSILEYHSVVPTYLLGLDSKDMSLKKWLSYQFVHSGFMHLLGNMVFLIIFGCMLEPIIGGLAFLIVYLLSGMVAAGVFLYLAGASSIPLIGASGSVSGIMAVFCFLFWKRPVRFIFFLFIPRRGYAGYIYLPGAVTLFMWVLSDLAGYWGTMKEFGGVAHAAHLGGELAGAIIAIIILSLRFMTKSFGELEKKMPDNPPMWTKIS